MYTLICFLITDGRVPESPLKGLIEFKNVDFSYPSRQDVPILHGLNLRIPQGSVVAVVGASGSGKSTLASLLLRYYDPQAGGVFVDGMDIKELNPQWLRRHMGIVSQVGTGVNIFMPQPTLGGWRHYVFGCPSIYLSVHPSVLSVHTGSL